MFSLKTRLLLLLLPVTLAALGAIGYFNYLKTTEIFTRSVQESLQTIVRSKQAVLIEHVESTEKLGAAIAATDIVQTYVELTNRNLKGRNQETVDRLGRRVGNLLYSLQEAHWGRYRHIFLINRSNRIVISPDHGARVKGSPSLLLDRDLSSNPWAMGAMQKGVTTISGYSRQKSSEPWQQMLFVPVRDASNRVQAVIGFELQVTYQQQVLKQGFNIGHTGRVYLTTDKGVPVVQKLIANQAPLSGDALAQARLTGASTARRTNTQGREVIGVYVKHRDYPWILAAEIDTDEVFAELYGLQIILIAGLAATLVMVTLLAMTFASAVGKPLREMASQLERISRGEFNIEILDTRRKDEIGKLIQALQKLTFSLRLVAKKLRQAKAMKKAG